MQGYIDLGTLLYAINTDQWYRRVPTALPILLISGENDPVGDMGKGVRRTADAFRKAGLSDVTLKLYPGLRHEILNEAAMRDTVYGDIGAWLDRVLG